MADIFLEQSKQIANNFIQNIVFIDDKAYQNDSTNNSFDTLGISKIFAEAGKICAVYAPESVSDITFYNTILKKADAVILDWRLDIRCNDDVIDSEADAECDEPRGEFTLELISNLTSQTDMLKLIIIYTGETNLFDITDSIYHKIKNYGTFEKKDCTIQSANIRILIRAKSQNSENQFAHISELKDKIVEVQQLPAIIIDEFTDMTNGLLSNFALVSISAIRNNTSRILSVFSPKLDPAYLSHKVLLENTSESKQLLIKLFGEAISDLLEATYIDTKDWVNNWIDSRIEEEKINMNGVIVKRSKELLKKMINSEQSRLKNKYLEASGKELSNKEEEKIQTHIIKLFAYSGIDIDKSNIDFAILTHHKNIFQPAIEPPILTLGTIIKFSKDEKDKYYICIQQRCDSVRIKEEEERRFLFLPLEKEGEYPLIINSALKLFPNKSTFALKTMKFKPQKGSTVIQASIIDGKYIFNSSYGEAYEWVVDLKEMQAQRILNSYCAQLSRVGLNESEWLRLKK